MSKNIERKSAVKRFVERWQREEGNEDSQARSFWIELFQNVLGIVNPTEDNLLRFERRVHGRKIDVYCEKFGILIENKSRGISLTDKIDHGKYGEETAYEQACWYRGNMSKGPKWIITCNFDELRIYDMYSGDSIPYEDEYSVRIMLEELPDKYQYLEKIIDPSTTRLELEKKVSVEATQLVGKMYDALMKQYKNIETDKKEQHDLNVLIVRLIFLLYAENAEILPNDHAFRDYLKDFKASYYRDALISLFRVLDTKGDERYQYDSERLKTFPYVNGGLFAEEITIPQFNDELAEILLTASAKLNWKDISPTIFGATFESTLNPETRRSGGMHYTSIENIHRVIDPLFLDDLKEELVKIEANSIKKQRVRGLLDYRKKLSQLTFLDPACGSGNFLTETYLCLRKLENLVIQDLLHEEANEKTVALNNVAWMYGINVNISQFYGIEINDFAVAVAKTALWIAEAQAKAEMEEITGVDSHILPLTENKNIVEGNALRMNWNDLIPNTQLNYIIGNPPFSGKKERGLEQKKDIELCYGEGRAKTLDYVSCWFKLATEYMKNSKTKAALVATKSITQGEQVYFWEQLLKEGARIDFAWRPFMWDSDSLSPAHVVCVIVGFSLLRERERERERTPRIFTVLPKNSGIQVDKVKWISPYLEQYPLLIVDSHSNPICKDAPNIIYGNMPIPVEPFIFQEDVELQKFLKKDKVNSLFIKPYIGGDEFIKGKKRWCLWLHNADKSIWQQSKSILERVKQCYNYRISRSREATRKLASTPELFGEIRQPDKPVLLIPKVTGCERDYIPIAYVTPDNIINGSAMYVDNSTLYHFGILTSIVHNAWMRAIAGRTGTSYQYSNNIVYNSFPWPEVSEEQIKEIEAISSKILEIRDSYNSKTLAYLYDRKTMPSDLLEAHKCLDHKVLKLYGLKNSCNERAIVCKLFEMYADITETEILSTIELNANSLL